MSRALIFALTLTLAAGCHREADSTATVGTGGYRVERLFTVDGCTAYRFQDVRMVHFVRCGDTTQTAWVEGCGKNCTRQAGVTTSSGANVENPEPRGDGLRMDGATNSSAAVTPAAAPSLEAQP